MVTISILLTIICCIIFSLSRRKHVCAKLPPGPNGIPIFGNLHQFGRRVHLKLHEWAQQYGEMYTIYFGQLPVLILNDKAVMKDLLGKMEATGKYQSELLTMTTWNGSYGLLTTEGKAWFEQKQFCLKVLRQLGFGRQSQMESMILQEAHDFSNWMQNEQSGRGAVRLNETINLSVGNAMMNIIAGEREELNESRIAHLSHEWVKFLQLGTQTGLAFLPWLKYIAPVKTGYTGLRNVCVELQKHVEDLFKNHSRTRRDGESARDVIDAYLDKMEACQDPASTFYGEEGRKHSLGSVAILMIAGMDGTGITLHWLLFYLSVFKDVQYRLQEEIDKVIGGREPCYSDKSAMPYLEAVILETLRFASQTTFGGTVTLLENVKFKGYSLPKGMMIASNLYHVHYNKAIWGDPERFRPTRFLEEGGDRRKEFVVAFHPGRRACPGEYFAKDILFLFVAKLFQKHTFSVHRSIKNPRQYLEPSPGFILYPQKLPLVVSTRAS